jgi:hypothetical protein
VQFFTSSVNVNEPSFSETTMLHLPAALVGALQQARLTSPGPRLAAALASTTAIVPLPALAEVATRFEPRGITPEDTAVFVLGCIPFVRAVALRTDSPRCVTRLSLLLLRPSCGYGRASSSGSIRACALPCA